MPKKSISIWNRESEYKFLDFYRDECDHTFNLRTKTFRYINKIESYNVKDNRIVFNCLTSEGEGIKVTLELCSSDVFRIIMSPKNGVENHKTLMVERYTWPTTEFEVIEHEGYVEVKTSDLAIKVSKKPWQIIVFNKENKIVTKEASVFWPSTEGDSYWPFREAYPLGFSIEKAGGKIRVFESFSIFPDEYFFGLGEKFITLNKRGREVICWNVDTGASTTTDRAYKNIPFFISTRGYGIFVNSSHKIRFQMGSYSEAAYSFEIWDDIMDYYFMYGPSFKRILDKYTNITGRPPVPPRWSFGTWMSHIPHSLDDQRKIEMFAGKIREERIPCDVIHIGGWLRPDKCPGLSCDLVWDRRRFPKPEKMLKKLRKMGFKICLWISPYVPKGTQMYKEGCKNGFFAKDNKGHIYKGLTWGAVDVGIIDFSNPEAVLWFKNKLKGLMKMGVHTFKADMGEYIPIDAFFSNGMRGEEMHNIYPVLYQKAVFEAVQEFHGKGIVWGRGGYTGIQRYPLQWAGDPRTRWEDMASIIRAGLSYGFSGVPFWSHDAGGFLGEPSFNLYVRWIQFGFFSSHTRCYGTTPRQPWIFGDEAVKIFKKYANLRYRLIPYLYSYANLASTSGLPLMRALPLEFQDDINTYDKDLQYILGEYLLVAPIFNDEGERWIYFPKGRWYSWWNDTVFEGPLNVIYKANIDELPLFVKAGAIIPLGPSMEYVGERMFELITIEVYPYGKTKFTLFEEDNVTTFESVVNENRINFYVDGQKDLSFIIKFHDLKIPKKCSKNDVIMDVVTITDEKEIEEKVAHDIFKCWYNPYSKILYNYQRGKKFMLSINFT